ncbi:MAG: EAL domain-containing protein [Lamprobacter sp.]|uniref:two-component system response regulator n=1 Tax=Lamprobacter sp. TaxID=3100796 RepID=UPI002B261E0F|nr:EAL domain-containing protein [Lamprobacter sp.]MEA3640332.1 EAL domain-containing protein [Lamprobacter sp.]
MQETPAKILLVDDDPTIRLLIQYGLTRAGYQVTEASNGLEALECFETAKPDLMLIDVSMPELDGFETVAAIRRREGGEIIPLVMVTGSDDNESVTKAFHAGATDFITKPINLPILTQRVRYALASAEREQRLRRIHLEQQSACELAKLGFWRLQIETGQLQWSQDAATLLGRSAAMPTSVAALIEEARPDQRQRLRQAFDQAGTRAAGLDLEIELARTGNACIIKLQSSPQIEDGVIVGAFQDVTALRAFEDQTLYLVEHDELTNLPNHRLFSRLLADRLERDQHAEARTGMLVIDIDRLHRINEAFGPMQGDEVIVTLANRLRQLLPSNSLLCRLESDSFGMAIPLESTDLPTLQAQLLSQLILSLPINGREIYIDCSMGLAIHPDDGQEAASLIQAAQAAERETNRDQSRRFIQFSEIREAREEGRVILETDLRRALEKQEFFLVYQPQQCLATQRIEGVEALLRWNHAERGIVSPVDFIPILEETGLIHEVGDWILEEAVRQAVDWLQQGLNLRMSVNLAAAQVENPQLINRLCALVKDYQLPPGNLELEITESTAMQVPEQTLLNLRKYKQCGFRIAIDDFGTGYSSLSYLLQFPLDTLKIDRAFVKEITRGKRNRAIVTALSTLSFHLGLTTIAEGVELESQRDYLDALNIDEIQGFLIARPLVPEQLFEFMSAHDADAQPSPRQAREPS